MIKFLRDLVNDTWEFISGDNIRVWRDGKWHKNGTRLYNVQCWYDDLHCEIFQIVAYSEEDAKQKARNVAWLKGYDVHNFGCNYVI